MLPRLAFTSAALAAFASPVAGLPRLAHRDAGCAPKNQRRAWHTLSDEEKGSYIDAVKCLMQAPPTAGFNNTRSKFDELAALHQSQSFLIHDVGAFLPWHRLFLHAHETLLRQLCGYKGAQPYWDETLDAGNFSSSVVLADFGGDGSGSGGSSLPCISSGPFAGHTTLIGPGYYSGTERCIHRQINESLSLPAKQDRVDGCLVLETFDEAWRCLERGPHSAGHAGVGGLMLDPIASPGDPLFMLHHAWLDRAFWTWQARSLPARVQTISGTNRPWPLGGLLGPGPFPPGSLPPGIPDPDVLLRADGEFRVPDALWDRAAARVGDGDADVTTLGHVLWMGGLVPDATVGDVLDVRNGPLLCYEYV